MSDPCNPTKRLTADERDAVLGRVTEVLTDTVETGVQTIGTSGIDFVMLSMAVWWAELVDLDARATSAMFAALSIIADPQASTMDKIAAEQCRIDTARDLIKAAVLAEATSDGKG